MLKCIEDYIYDYLFVLLHRRQHLIWSRLSPSDRLLISSESAMRDKSQSEISCNEELKHRPRTWIINLSQVMHLEAYNCAYSY